ncbi:STAS domain-containing protein [Mycolicibacterium sp. XJ870]
MAGSRRAPRAIGDAACRGKPGAISAEVFRSPTGCLVRVKGAFTGSAAERTRRLLIAELQRSPRLLALDLSDVSDMDTAATDLLTAIAKLAGEFHIALALTGSLQHRVEDALRRAGLTDLFSTTPTPGQALTPAPGTAARRCRTPRR